MVTTLDPTTSIILAVVVQESLYFLRINSGDRDISSVDDSFVVFPCEGLKADSLKLDDVLNGLLG